MPKSKANVDIIAAAEAVYAILAENNIKACAIGSMAIAYTTKIGRDPDVIGHVSPFISLINYSTGSR